MGTENGRMRASVEEIFHLEHCHESYRRSIKVGARQSSVSGRKARCLTSVQLRVMADPPHPLLHSRCQKRIAEADRESKATQVKINKLQDALVNQRYAEMAGCCCRAWKEIESGGGLHTLRGGIIGSKADSLGSCTSPFAIQGVTPDTGEAIDPLPLSVPRSQESDRAPDAEAGESGRPDEDPPGGFGAGARRHVGHRRDHLRGPDRRGSACAECRCKAGSGCTWYLSVKCFVLNARNEGGRC